MQKANHRDILIIGAGAAGLMAAIQAARACQAQGVTPRLTIVDGAKKIGAKILVAGGGRCNVTHHRVLPKDYAGGSRNAIKNVLKAFSERDTVAFYDELGVALKREDTGKLFPVTDSAQTVLSALLGECDRLHIEIRHPWRAGSVIRTDDRLFVITSADDRNEPMTATQLVLATGGMALPRSGSDGGGYALAKSLGHTLTPRVFPALVPLVTDDASRWVTELSGIALRATLEVRSATSKRLASFTNEMLCTHFGLSGPGVLDISRWYLDAKHEDPGAALVISWLPGTTFDALDADLQCVGKQSIVGYLRQQLPERLARGLCERSGVDPAAPGHSLTRDQRRALVRLLTECPVAIERDRGFTFAETTAGGVPLSEINVSSMRSRVCDNLWLIGELLDVDGRIGGFNFQWAWSTGTIAGRSLARSLYEETGAQTP